MDSARESEIRLDHLPSPPLRKVGERTVRLTAGDPEKIGSFVPLPDFPGLSYDLSRGKTRCLSHAADHLVISRASKVHIVHGDNAISCPRRIDDLHAGAANSKTIVYLAGRDREFGILDVSEGRLSLFGLDLPIFTVAITEDILLAGMRESPDGNGTLLCMTPEGRYLWATPFKGAIETSFGPVRVQPYRLLIAKPDLFFVASWSHVLRIDVQDTVLHLADKEVSPATRGSLSAVLGDYMAHAPVQCLAYEPCRGNLFVSDQSNSLSCWDSVGNVMWRVEFGYYGCEFCLFRDLGIWAWGNRPGGGFLGYFTQSGDHIGSLPFPSDAIRTGKVGPDGSLVFVNHGRSGAWRATIDGCISRIFEVTS